MKKFFALLFILPLFTACEKDPDNSKLDSDFVVYTDHDQSAEFDTYSTYYIPDSVLIVSNKETPEYMTGSEGDKIIQAISDQMDSRDYTRVYSKDQADLGLQVSWVKDTYYFNNNTNNPYWWWGYPGYWGPGYWGGWNGWYYPYNIVYGYKVGSLLTEIASLKDGRNRTDNKLPIIWTAYMTGLLSSSEKVNTELSVTAINQAFAQSQYIKK